ncbi:hypothetical protein [Micromonospora sp. RL09-050-HVF-A]|uniref:hypothetical protein n=1 Tax=Micromonospora sp. RL09-050-HVF-A TaxID=1703433 RepID=UPI001C5E226B|nr:hypothetical protein [Micromonospora sp. RL09-050-HVF-A]MBW4705168.1 hypothetical protein [Micromonospora sp. RL09-050-HVF-A]
MIRKRTTKKRPTRRSLDPADIVPVVADGSIAGPIADGRMVPLVIIDTATRPDLDELVRLHDHLSPGDVTYRWGQVDRDDDQVALSLQFTRPIEVRATLLFSIEHEGIIVDAALNSRALYLQPGRPGDRLKHDPRRPKILIETPDDDFRDRWEDVVIQRLTKVIRRQKRMPRAEARQLAADLLDQSRSLSRFRMPA